MGRSARRFRLQPLETGRCAGLETRPIPGANLPGSKLEKRRQLRCGGQSVYAYVHCHLHPNRPALANTIVYAHIHTHADADANPAPFADAYDYPYTHQHTHGHSHPSSNENPDAVHHSSTDIDEDAHPIHYGHAHKDAFSHANIHPNEDPNPISHEYPSADQYTASFINTQPNAAADIHTPTERNAAPDSSSLADGNEDL